MRRQIHGLLALLAIIATINLPDQGNGQISSVQPLPTPKGTPRTTERESATNGSREAPKRQHYYDQRERVSSNLTFEWLAESNSVYLKEDGSKLTLSDLQDIYKISRTPMLTRIDLTMEAPLITSDGVRKSDLLFQSTVYYFGQTGEIVLNANRDTKGTVTSASIFQPGANGFGLPNLYLPGLSMGGLIFLAGISPMRLMDAPLSSWQISEVNENEWVLELSAERQKQPVQTGLLRFDRIEVHLSRRHGDAPARLEISLGGVVYRWKTLEYTQRQGVWMPQKVLLEFKSGEREIQTLYYLNAVYRTAGVAVDIPRGTPVLDWRWRGRTAWAEGFNSISINLNKRNSSDVLDTFTPIDWTPALEQELWRSVQRSQ